MRVERKEGAKLHQKLNICLRPTAHKHSEGKTQRTLERQLKSASNCWKRSEFHKFCVVAGAGAGAGSLVTVCVVACLVCQKTSSLVNKTLCVGRTHFQSAFAHQGVYTWTAFKRQVF